jgi:integrase
MASIRQRNGKYQVQIRRKGHRSVTKSFLTKNSACQWARSAECQVESGQWDKAVISGLRLRDLLVRYRDSVTVTKRSSPSETIQIARLLRDPISAMSLKDVTSDTIATFRDRRVQDGVRACQYDLAILRHMFRLAIEEWNIPLAINPVAQVRKPKSNKARDRRLKSGEYELLRTHADRSRATYLWPLIALAIETGMRRGELLALTWNDIELDERLARLYDTKNGEDRTIPLTCEAVAFLRKLSKSDERVFPLTPVAVRQAWDRLIRRAGIANLRFHDLRHEAISRFFEKGLSVPEVALISGHKTPSQLFRYTQMTAEHVLTKLK